MKSTERGHLTALMRSRHQSISSWASSGPASAMSAGCTTAFTSSPKSSLGTPITATSVTLGWVMRQFSVSWG